MRGGLLAVRGRPEQLRLSMGRARLPQTAVPARHRPLLAHSLAHFAIACTGSHSFIMHQPSARLDAHRPSVRGRSLPRALLLFADSHSRRASACASHRNI